MGGGWKYIPTSNMRQISVGAKGRVFATARNDTIWTRVGVKGKWQNIPGRLRWIATNSRNQVTGCNKYNTIYFALSGKAAKIVRKWSKRAVTKPKRVHKMKKARKVTAHRAKLMKKKVSKKAAKRMAKKVSKKVLLRFKRKVSKKAKRLVKRNVRNHTGRKWFIHSRFGSWKRYYGWAAIGGRLRQVSIGKNGVQWGVAMNDTIWTRTTGGWRHVNGRLMQISVSDDGKVWGVNRAHYIFVLLNAKRGQWKCVPGRLKQVSVGRNHNVWGVNRANQIFARIGGINGHWKYIPGRLSQISVGYDGTVWGVNRYRYIYWRNGLKGGWKLIPGRLRQVSVGSKRIFGIDRYHRIWTRVGVKGRWILIPGRLTYVATNSHNQLTGTNRYGSIYFGIANKAQAKKLKKR